MRQEVLLEYLWILRLLFCELWFHFEIQRCFGAIKLRHILGKLGDLVHKLCITTEQVLCLSPDFNSIKLDLDYTDI